MSRNPRTDSSSGIDERPSRSKLLSLLFWVATVTLSATAAKGQTCEPHWSDDFPNADLSSFVRAITEFDDGSGQGPALYIGGYFLQSGGQALNHVARLDSANGWASVGGGTDKIVKAMTVFDDGLGDGEALYVGGPFDTAGGVAAHKVAKWDGTAWSSLGEGIGGFVESLAVFDDGSGAGAALYAGGFFNTAGGASANNIARWDGETWSPLGTGTDGAVRVMVGFDDGLGGGPALYVAGSFDNAGGVPARKIAKWDGQIWSPLATGINGSVYALTVFDDGSGSALFSGGSFDDAGGVAASNVAKWDGESWSPVGGGTDDLTVALCVFDDGSGSALYAGGLFEEAGNMQIHGIARWDGESWSPLGNGVFQSAWALAVYDDGSEIGPVLCVGGNISQAGALPASHFAQWDGSDWSTAGGGLVNYNSFTAGWALTAVEEGSGVESGLYVGGNFFTAGGVEATSIAHWDGESFSSVGSGTDGEVRALAVFDDGSGPALYAGGWFTEAGGISASSIAKWDGQIWSPLGFGINGLVYALTVFDDGLGSGPLLYAAGEFLVAGGEFATRIATWNGAEWAPLAGGGANDRIFSLTVWDDGSGDGPALYAGGFFTMAGGADANFIAKWDGVQWSSLGRGMDGGSVLALAAYDDGSGPALYAGGRFETAGGVQANDIAKWDGKTWSALPGGGISGPGFPSVRTLAVFDDGLSSRPALYIGGSFETVGGIDANHLARWDGKMWSPLGSGLEDGYAAGPPTALAMEEFDDGSGDGPGLFVTGDFLIAGGISSQRIAKWIVCADPIPGDIDGDGSVGATDLLILLTSWGPCDDCNDCVADLDGDCTVGAGDLLILLVNWG